ncbi:MAG: BMP family lipoprotein [Candidatus Thorarchaeota archaeon]
MSSRVNILTSLVIVIIVFGAVGGILLISNPFRPNNVILLSLAPGRGDMSLTDQAWEGMLEIAGDIALDINIPDELPETVAEARDFLETYAASGHYELIVVLGDALAATVNTVAVDFPAQKFALVGGQADGDNIVSATFAVEEAAFLGGVLAAFLAADDEDRKNIGIIRAVSGDPNIDEMIDGFLMGVDAANSTYNLGVSLLPMQTIGSNNDSAMARTLVFSAFVSNDASILFTPVRSSMQGVRLGMEDANETLLYYQDRMPLVIAAERNLDYYGLPNPDILFGESWIATSVVPRSDLVIYDFINLTLWEEFPEGIHTHYHLESGYVNITDFQYSNTYIMASWLNSTKDYQTAIINGTITFP